MRGEIESRFEVPVMRECLNKLLPIVISMMICATAIGCPPKPAPLSAAFESDSNIDPITVVITTEKEVLIGYLPDCTIQSKTFPRDDVLSYWSDGVLLKGTGVPEWMDFDRGKCEFISNPGVDLDQFEKPLSVNPGEKIIYALGHTVPPSRAVEAHHLDGREFDQIGALVADEVEPIWPMPSNGWILFWVDRPDQTGNNPLDDTPTRKLRVYGEGNIGGEFYDVIDYFLINDGLIMNTEKDGWVLFEAENVLVRQRTMSLGQIPGKLRPLARDVDEILIASDSPDNTGSVLYTYGAYTRGIGQLWDPSDLLGDVKIHALAVKSPGDYYLIADSTEKPGREFSIVHLVDGNASVVGTVTFADEARSAQIFVNPMDETAVEETGD